jgi:hypothetical protein
MKKIIFIAIITVFSLNSIIAQRFTSKQFEIVGVEHNRMLDVAYNTIKNNKLTNSNKTELLPVLENDISKSKEFSEKDIELAKEFLNNFGKEEIKIDENFYSFKNSNEISEKNRAYLDKLYKIVMNEKLSVNDLINSIQKLELEIYNDSSIDNKQLLIFYSGSNVAKYSSQYWEKNEKAWFDLGLSNNNSLYRKGGSRRVVGADVIGGVAGAATAWMTNVVPGAGQIAYGTAIAVGAVGNSICEAGSQFMDWMGW